MSLANRYATAIRAAGAPTLDPAAVDSLAAVLRDIHLCGERERHDLATAGNAVPGDIRAQAFERLARAIKAGRSLRRRKSGAAGEACARAR